MVWGAISYNKKDWSQGEPRLKGRVLKGGTVTGKVMTEQILPHLASFRDAYEDEQISLGMAMYMEDSAGAHRLKLWIEALILAGLPRSYYPANAPDLNPIEPI